MNGGQSGGFNRRGDSVGDRGRQSGRPQVSFGDNIPQIPLMNQGQGGQNRGGNDGAGNMMLGREGMPQMSPGGMGGRGTQDRGDNQFNREGLPYIGGSNGQRGGNGQGLANSEFPHFQTGREGMPVMRGDGQRGNDSPNNVPFMREGREGMPYMEMGGQNQRGNGRNDDLGVNGVPVFQQGREGAPFMGMSGQDRRQDGLPYFQQGREGVPVMGMSDAGNRNSGDFRSNQNYPGGGYDRDVGRPSSGMGHQGANQKGNTGAPYNDSIGNLKKSQPAGGMGSTGSNPGLSSTQWPIDPNIAGYHSSNQKFTGTSHPDATIFKNLPGGHSSLASQGILRKNPSRMNAESLGMNPNIKVEDEYIDNLMKQIHFMNLEINLLKEKQDENKDVMGIRALMQKDKNGYVEHIIEANTKFMDLLKNMAREKITLDDRLLRCEEREEKLTILRDLLKKRHGEANNKYRDSDGKLRQQVNELRDKLHADRDFRMELQNQHDKLAKNLTDAKLKNDELSKYMGEKDLFDKIQKHVEGEDDKVLIEQKDQKAIIINSLLEVRDAKLKLLNDDMRLTGLKEDNVKLLAEILKKQIEASDCEYKVMEIEARQQLAIKIKDKESQEKKNLQDEYEILKDRLEEEQKKNNEKIAKKLRESNFDELGKRDIILRKAQEELNVLRSQYDRIHKEYKNFRLDMLRKGTYLDKLQKENEENEKKLNETETTTKDVQMKVDEFKIKVEDLEEKIKEIAEQESTLKSRCNALEEECADLSSRVNYINKNFNLDDLLKGINLDELKRVMDSNMQINSNITELLNKWDGMRRFGRGQVDADQNQ